MNPYSDWLQIRADNPNPNHYELLGLPFFEADLQVIREHYWSRYALVRTYQVGAFSDLAIGILDELSKAFECLADANAKRKYDDHLRKHLGLDIPGPATTSAESRAGYATTTDEFDELIQAILSKPSDHSPGVFSPASESPEAKDLSPARFDESQYALAPPAGEGPRASLEAVIDRRDAESDEIERKPELQAARKTTFCEDEEYDFPGLTIVGLGAAGSVLGFVGVLLTRLSINASLGWDVFLWFPLLSGYLVIFLGGMWRIHEKGGYDGVTALVPIWNILILHELAGLPPWFVLTWWVPGLNWLMVLLLCFGIAKNFSRGWKFAAALFLLGFLFFPWLGYGPHQYTGEWKLQDDEL